MIKLRNILLEEIQKEFQPVKLRWKYKDYEPAFDAETMKLHFEKHYKGYIEKLNQAVKEENIPLTYDGDRLVIRPLLSTISTYSDKAKNNAGGFFNHNIWFNQLNPDTKGKMALEEGSPIDTKIKEQYGSLDKFKAQYKEKALSNFGSGWTWLLYDKGQLRIVNTSNQDNPYMDFINEPGEILMGIDLWEHSYYLKYKNDRAKYIDAFYKLICFKTVNERLMKAIDSIVA
jgi:Fe-Mn family superoxide dismutase